MYERFAEVYDLAYNFVDYASGARIVRNAIATRLSGARSLLELACGTGLYLVRLAEDFDVEGLDRSPQMLAKAAARLPGVVLHQADMAAFTTGRRYDVVCCLFRSISYLRSAKRLEAAVCAMAAHLAPGGIVLIEPFFAPDSYWTNRVTVNEARDRDTTLCWMYVSERDGLEARLRIHFLLGTCGGVEHFVEDHLLGLFSRADFERAFSAADLTLEFEPAGPMGTGLYIGRRRES